MRASVPAGPRSNTASFEVEGQDEGDDEIEAQDEDQLQAQDERRMRVASNSGRFGLLGLGTHVNRGPVRDIRDSA